MASNPKRNNKDPWTDELTTRRVLSFVFIRKWFLGGQASSSSDEPNACSPPTLSRPPGKAWKRNDDKYKVKDSKQTHTVTSLAIYQDQDNYAERLTLLFWTLIPVPQGSSSINIPAHPFRQKNFLRTPQYFKNCKKCVGDIFKYWAVPQGSPTPQPWLPKRVSLKDKYIFLWGMIAAWTVLIFCRDGVSLKAFSTTCLLQTQRICVS